MIYICKGCGGCCSSCGKACDECGKCCNEACAPCCKMLERPLGGYVLLTGIAMLLVAICGGLGMPNKQVSDCDNPVMALCAGCVALAFVHAGFAVYLQHKLV